MCFFTSSEIIFPSAYVLLTVNVSEDNLEKLLLSLKVVKQVSYHETFGSWVKVVKYVPNENDSVGCLNGDGKKKVFLILLSSDLSLIAKQTVIQGWYVNQSSSFLKKMICMAVNFTFSLAPGGTLII